MKKILTAIFAIFLLTSTTGCQTASNPVANNPQLTAQLANDLIQWSASGFSYDGILQKALSTYLPLGLSQSDILTTAANTYATANNGLTTNQSAGALSAICALGQVPQCSGQNAELIQAGGTILNAISQ